METKNEANYLNHNMNQLNTVAKNAIIYVTSTNEFMKPDTCFEENCCKLVRTKVQEATTTRRATLQFMVEYPVNSGTVMSLKHFRKEVKKLMSSSNNSFGKYYFLRSDKKGYSWYNNPMRWGFAQVQGLESLVYVHADGFCNSIVFDDDENCDIEMLKPPKEDAEVVNDTEEAISSDDEQDGHEEDGEYRDDCSEQSEDDCQDQHSEEEEEELQTPKKLRISDVETPRSLRAKKRNIDSPMPEKSSKKRSREKADMDQDDEAEENSAKRIRMSDLSDFLHALNLNELPDSLKQMQRIVMAGTLEVDKPNVACSLKYFAPFIQSEVKYQSLLASCSK